MSLGYHEEIIPWLSADAVTTEYTIGSLGFEPKFVMVTCMGFRSDDPTSAGTGSNDWNFSIGFAEDSGTRRSVSTFSDDANATADDCGAMLRDDAVLHMVDGSGALTGALDIAFDSAGIRLIVDDTAPVDTSVLVKIWGGTDISAVVVGDIAEPAATGNADYTATGMVSGANADQVLFLAGVQSTAAANSGAAIDAGMYFGMAHDSGQWINMVNSDDGSATSDTDHYGRSGECVAMCTNGGGSPNARASFTQWNTNGFRLNWAARATTNRRSIFMAVKGGQWAVGGFTIDAATANSTATVSGLAFQPEGLVLATCTGAEEAAGTGAVLSAISIGGGTSTSNRHCLMIREDNGATTTAIWQSVRYDCGVGMQNNGTGTRERWDINAINSDGFQLITDQNNASDSATWWLAYAAFASDAGQTVAIGLDSETDEAFTLTWKKAKAIGLNTETDTSQAMTRVKSRAIGLNTEDDSALAVTRAKFRAIGLNTETDEAFPVTAPGQTVAIGLATEADEAFAFTFRKALAIGLNNETDLAQAMGRLKALAIGLNLEADVAQSFAHAKRLAIGLNLEADTTFAAVRAKALAIGLNGETDSPFSLVARKAKAIGLNLEADLAQVCRPVRIRQIGQTTEADATFAFTWRKVKLIGQPVEVDEALNVTSNIITPGSSLGGSGVGGGFLGSDYLGWDSLMWPRDG